MTHFHRIETLDDEQDLLSKIIHLETQIRAQKEKERLISTGQNETLGKIFEPITRELKNLSEITTSASTVPVRRILPPTPLDVNTDLHETRPPLTPRRPAPATPNPYPTPGTPRSQPPAPELQSNTPRATPRIQHVQTSYERALTLVNKKYSDGVLGLNPKTGRIQDKTFSVHGDSFTVTDVDNSQKSFIVKNPYTWVYLLAKNPSEIVKPTDPLTGAPTESAAEYRNIAQKLNLVENLTKINVKKGYKKRNKYKLITAKTGKGFLFSVLPPPMLRKKGKGIETFLPSDKQGILRELKVALAEYEAGNKSLRNIIVALYQQAKRQKILPKTLEKTLKNKFNWIYI